MNVVGLMSGTSLDGQSIGYTRIEQCPHPFVSTFIAGKTYPFPNDLKRDLLSLAASESVSTQLIAKAHRQLGILANECLKRFLQEKSLPKPDLVGFHGQTIYHEPSSDGTTTLQIGDPSPICCGVEIPVVSDFRSMDVAAGGQGAPLVPIVDFLTYKSSEKTRIVLNIGGIANITALPRDCSLSKVVAFDVGPGNILIDAIVAELTNHQLRYDEGGSMAFSGHASKQLLDSILEADNYRMLPYPKTTGRERYGKTLVNSIISQGRVLALSNEDIIATATHYTTHMINHHIHALAEDGLILDELIVGGGGSRNRYIMNSLQKGNSKVKVALHDEYGIPSIFWESYAFAVLAYLTYHSYTGNVISATGASKEVALGRINFPAKNTLK